MSTGNSISFNNFHEDGGNLSIIGQTAAQELNYNPDRYQISSTASGINPELLDVVYRSKREEQQRIEQLDATLRKRAEEQLKISAKNQKEEQEKIQQLNKSLRNRTSNLLKADPSQVLQQDIARSNYFTVDFGGMFAEAQFTVPGGAFSKSKFLPVKAISISYGSIDTFSVPVACFMDVPVISKRKVGKITLETYDLDNDCIENGFRTWMQAMTVKGRNVYLSEIVCPMHYRSYNVKGQLNPNSITPLVVPIGEIGVSRSYEVNSEKLIKVTLAIVGSIN